MNDREESPFVRAQASRSLIRPQPRKFACLSPSSTSNRSPIANREPTNPMIGGTPPKRLSASHTPLESLKQWELVEDDRGLQVVEKRASALGPTTIRSKDTPAVHGIASPLYDHSTPVSGRRFFGGTNANASLEEKLRVFNHSKIVQPIGLPLLVQQGQELISLDPSETKAQPLSLDLILKQQQQHMSSATAESTDMLQRLEQQVKAIEMSTIAARTTRQLENSSDFGPEVQLRYREHEDLLRNVTDDEAEG